MPPNEHDLDDLILLSTDESVVVGTLTIMPLGHPEDVTEDVVRAVLSGKGVRDSAILGEEICKLLAAVRGDPTIEHSGVVARGTPPVHGTDASYELVPELQERVAQVKARRESLEQSDRAPEPPRDQGDGDTDYYEQSSFVVVERGDPVARVLAGREPEDGTDLFGHTIESRSGTPIGSVLDESVTIDEDGAIAAAVSGVLVAKPDSLTVNETLSIGGDVDFSTGRIRFPGDVTIRGAVRDHFHVRSGGSVQVQGLVECANITSTHGVIFKNGMAGKGGGTLDIGGDLEAGYLEGVLGIIRGDASIAREITNCTLRVLGLIDAPRAAVRGGALELTKGGSVGSLGSAQGVVTKIVLGSIPEIEGVLKNIERYTGLIAQTLESDKKQLESYRQSIPKPTAQQIEEQMGMQFRIDELESRFNMLGHATSELCTTFSKRTDTTLHVKRGIFPKVEIAFPGYVAVFDRELSGECSVATDGFGTPVITYKGKTEPLCEHAKVTSDERVPKLVRRPGAQSEPERDIAA